MDAVQRAPAAVLARRRPVEGGVGVAGCPGNRAGKEGRRGALGSARALGPAVSVLGRRAACTAWRGRGAVGGCWCVLLLCEGARR